MAMKQSLNTDTVEYNSVRIPTDLNTSTVQKFQIYIGI